jgi:hypothetical protein
MNIYMSCEFLCFGSQFSIADSFSDKMSVIQSVFDEIDSERH